MSPTEKVLDTLRKLIEHSRSAHSIGNVAEAEAFAAKAAELLLRHKLNMTDVEFAQAEQDEPPIKEVLKHADLGTTHADGDATWTGVLLRAVAEANFCRSIRMPGYRALGLHAYDVLVGRKSDCESAKALFGYLCESCVDAARNAATHQRWRATVDVTEHFGTRRTFISGFKVGFAQAIYRRLERKRAELKAGASEQALVRIDQMERRVEEKVRELYPEAREGPRRLTADQDGYLAGERYGSTVGINSTKRLKGA